MLNDGGFQHSAGAQFADSIAVSGVAAVSNVRAGHRRWSKPRCIAVCQAGSKQGRGQVCRSAKS